MARPWSTGDGGIDRYAARWTAGVKRASGLLLTLLMTVTTDQLADGEFVASIHQRAMDLIRAIEDTRPESCVGRVALARAATLARRNALGATQPRKTAANRATGTPGA
jgi:hypothetical protein